MNKHEKQLDIYRSEYIVKLEKELEQEKAKREQLEKDVKRYYDIRTSSPKGMSIDDWKKERESLEIKLSKVGN